MEDRFVFFSFSTIGICCALFLHTVFVPDEYWQSLEVAYKMTFGYGYLTWEWKKKIRSYFYPFLIHILYKILPETLTILILAPRVFQALLSATGHYFTHKLATKYFGPAVGRWTIFNLSTSWFLFYCGSRTLTNMAETALCTWGLYYYPFYQSKSKKSSCKYMMFAGASVLMRPTAAIFWIPLCINHIRNENDVVFLFKQVLLYGCCTLAVLLLCDRYFYDEWVFTPYNFFLLNWSHNIGAFYGEHNFLWYFMQGLPVVLGVHLIPFLLGLFVPSLRFGYLQVLWFMLILSFLSHKEFRFLLPIVPLCLIVSSVAMHTLSTGGMHIFGVKVPQKIAPILVGLILIVNVPLSYYTTQIHQKGPIDAMTYLAKSVHSGDSVLFLMPCHSTPYYSYLHQNITLKFLECEPNFDNRTDYIEEAEDFYNDPASWLAKTYEASEKTHFPSFIVMFESLYQKTESFLKRHNYELCYETFHSHFPESRTGQYVHIYCV